ncbi:ABC transporter substrate-binding protein, partial [bacterium]|nr:ABC transporter substrate-binding protein [bacterium]
HERNMLMKTLLSFGIPLFIAIAAAFPASSLADVPSDKLQVGVILPLSGESASVGEAIRNGMLLSYDHLPAEVRSKLELVFEDDGLKPKSTIAAYRKLAASGDLDVVVTASSGTSNALAPLTENDKRPLIAIATDPKVVAGRSYAVNFWVTPEEQARVGVQEALKRGYRRIARISTIQDAMLSLKNHFDEEVGDRIKVVLDEEYPAEIKDFRPYITKLKGQQDLDALVVGLMPGQLGVFARQVRQLGVTLPIFGFESLEDSNEVAASNGALVDQWYVNTDDPDRSFIEKFKHRYPNSSLYGASNGHDIVLLLASTIKQELDAEGINTFLHTVQGFSGALGEYSATKDNRFTLPAAVKIVTRDGFRKLYDSSSVRR